MLDRFTVAERAAAGLLTELTQAGSWKDKNLEFAWEETQYKGKTYALPFDTDARALFYNIDLLKASGVDQATIDSLDAKNGPVTLDEIRQIADKVDKKDANGAYTTLGFMPWPSPSGGQNQGWHYTWGFAWGGQFADIAACKVTPTEQPIVDAFQWMYDWAKDHGPQQLATWFSTYSPPNNPAAQDPFVTGKLAMTIVGDWRIAEMKQYAPNVNYGITWIPVPKKGMESVTWAGGWSMVIPTGAKHPDDAWKFLEYIDGDPGQAIYTKETAHLPTVKSLLTDQSLYEERHKFFLDLLKVAKSRPVLPVGALYWDALTRAQQAVVTNTQTPKEALQAAENSVQPRLQRFCPLT
jgi:multiple sugar transport system substrate-binding protein